MSLIYVLGQSLFGAKANAPDVWAATATTLREMLVSCPSCGSSLNGHSYKHIAEAGNRADMAALLTAEADRDWSTLHSISSFEALKNAIVATAIKCQPGTGAIVTYMDPYDYFEPETLIRKSVLTPEEWRRLEIAITDGEWKYF